MKARAKCFAASFTSWKPATTTEMQWRKTMAYEHDIMDYVFKALERPYPEPDLVEAPPLVANMSAQEQDGYIAEFAERNPDGYRLIVFDAISPGHIGAHAMCEALADGDDAEAGRLMREMVRSDVVDVIDRQRGARP
jgi:hypothetical protein